MGFKYYYYKLDDVCEGYVNPITHNTGSTEFADVAANIVWPNVAPTWTQTTNTAEYAYLEECWLRVRSLFQIENNYFWTSLNDIEDQDDLIAEASYRLGHFFNTFYITKDKYIALIKAQETLKADILKDVQNTTETWFNDTPQTSGNYTDLSFASNYTRNKASISLGPVSEKLSEVDKAMEDIYDRWVREFNKFIIVY